VARFAIAMNAGTAHHGVSRGGHWKAGLAALLWRGTATSLAVALLRPACLPHVPLHCHTGWAWTGGRRDHSGGFAAFTWHSPRTAGDNACPGAHHPPP